MLDFFSVTACIFDISIELTPPSLRATSPIFCYAKHPAMLRGTVEEECEISPIVKTEISCNVTGHGRGGVAEMWEAGLFYFYGILF